MFLKYNFCFLLKTRVKLCKIRHENTWQKRTRTTFMKTNKLSLILSMCSRVKAWMVLCLTIRYNIFFFGNFFFAFSMNYKNIYPTHKIRLPLLWGNLFPSSYVYQNFVYFRLKLQQTIVLKQQRKRKKQYLNNLEKMQNYFLLFAFP